MFRKSLEKGGFLPLLCVCLIVAATAASAEEPEFFEKTSESWFEPVGEGKTIRVNNPYGAIYARFGGYDPKAEIIATIQRLEPDQPKLIVDRQTVDGDLTITVKIEGATDDRVIERRDRIDLVLFAPIGRRVELNTIEDTIAAKGLQGDVVARSVSGDISLRKIKGAVDIETQRGKVLALLETGVTKLDQRFESVTGDLEITLYEDADLDVAMATSGQISTDFSLSIEHRRFEEPGKIATATVNAGGPKLSIRSKRGHVSLLRQQKFFGSQPAQSSGQGG